jgi:hypothetical protein
MGVGGIAPPFLISVLDGCEWLYSHPGLFNPEPKSKFYSLDRKLGESQSRLEAVEKRKNFISYRELNPSHQNNSSSSGNM